MNPRPLVLIADDHPLMAQGLRALIAQFCDVVAVVEDARQVEAAVEEHNDGCTPGQARCEGTTPQQCNDQKNWESCSACAFLETDPHNCGACGKDCKGLSCSGGVCAEIVTLSTPGGEALAIDATNAYWLASAWDADAGASVRTVKKSGLNGENPSELWHGSAGRAFAVGASNIYWAVAIYNSDPGEWVSSLVETGLNGGAHVCRAPANDFGARCSADNQDKLAAWIGEALAGRAERPTPDLLVDLGEFAGDCDLTIPENVLEVLQ